MDRIEYRVRFQAASRLVFRMIDADIREKKTFVAKRTPKCVFLIGIFEAEISSPIEENSWEIWACYDPSPGKSRWNFRSKESYLNHRRIWGNSGGRNRNISAAPNSTAYTHSSKVVYAVSWKLLSWRETIVKHICEGKEVVACRHYSRRHRSSDSQRDKTRLRETEWHNLRSSIHLSNRRLPPCNVAGITTECRRGTFRSGAMAWKRCRSGEWWWLTSLC